MHSVVLVQHFPSFAIISAPNAANKCIHPTTKPGNPLCQKYSFKEGRVKAAVKLRAIRQAIRSEGLGDIIKEYAVLRCCLNMHDDRLKDSDLLDELAARWTIEVNASVPVPVSISTPPPPPPPPTATPVVSAILATASDDLAMNGKSLVSDPPLLRSTRRSNRKEPKPQQQPHATTPAKPDFAPYVRGPRYTFEAKIREPLKKTGWKTGTLYLFTRPSSPGFGKIGYTTGKVEQRMKRWEDSCHYKPVVEYSIENVPHVFRVEGMVHTGLSKYWRRETRCKHNPNCPTRHQEWFEIDIEFAKQVMDKCVQLMRATQLYNESGLLHDNWVDVLRKLKKAGKAISVQVLLDAVQPSPVDGSIINEDSALETRSEVDSRIETSQDQLAQLSRLAVPQDEPTVDISELSSLLESLSQELRLMKHQRISHSTLDLSLYRLSSSASTVRRSLQSGSAIAAAA